jgi:hypothetical protein
VTSPSMTSAFRSLALAAALTAALASASAQPQKASPQNAPAPPDFAMSVDQEPFLRVAEAFVAAVAAGDMGRAAGMISPAVAARTGREAVEDFLAGEVGPFFADHVRMANSVTVTRTAEVTGFAFYMYTVTRANELRPFVIYVVEEGGAQVIANVLVDKFVENRHCARVGASWKCPDFS